MPGDALSIHIAKSRSAIGARAAADIADEIRKRLESQPGVRMMFAAAPSQSEMLAALREGKGVDWSRVTAFHMDEYLNLSAVDDGCFATLSAVPSRALTVTIPALLAAHVIFCTVPGRSKTEAVDRAVISPIDPACPASALRRHPHCTLYLDGDSCGSLLERIPFGQTVSYCPEDNFPTRPSRD